MTATLHLPSIDVLRTNGRSFYFASRLLRSKYRERAARLYAFCRYVDDVADKAPHPMHARETLWTIKQSVIQKNAHHPCVRDMLHLCKDISLADEPVLSLIDGVDSDLNMSQFKDEALLIQYAYKVAGTVGLMMCAALDVTRPEALPFAVDLGIAMQLTNIARDVGEDAQMGRIYLPSSWVGELSPDQVLNPNPQQKELIQGAVARLIALADTYYKSGMQGIAYLPSNARYGIAVAAMVYREIGCVLDENAHASWSFRATVPLQRKWVCASKTLVKHALNLFGQSTVSAHDPDLHRHLTGFLGTSRAA
jgi:phytoene synthase